MEGVCHWEKEREASEQNKSWDKLVSKIGKLSAYVGSECRSFVIA